MTAVNTAINYLDSNFDVGQNVTFDLTFGTSATLPQGTIAQTEAS